MAIQATANAEAMLLEELREEEAKLLTRAQAMIRFNKNHEPLQGFEFKDFTKKEFSPRRSAYRFGSHQSFQLV